jgi:zinc transport system permease protein
VIISFLSEPLIALFLISICASLLGNLVLWKKFAYFGDGLSHSVLLGLLLSSVFQINENFALICLAIIFCFFIIIISKNKYFSNDTIIAIITYFFIGIAGVINDIFPETFDLESYIFGDLMKIDISDLKILVFVTFLVIIYLFISFKKLLLISINEDLARVGGINVGLWNASFLIMLALVIAFCAKIVGVLLMSAMIVLPSSIARVFAKSPLKMVFLSLLNCLIIAFISFKISGYYSINPVSLMIVIFCFIFCLSIIIKKFSKYVG